MEKEATSVRSRILQAEEALSRAFARIDDIEEQNTRRVLDAFRQARLAARHMSGTTGYGYGDEGRETLELVFAALFSAQKALVRPQFASGTHALATCLLGVLRPGQTLVCATGAPYDTLMDVIDGGEGSLADFGVRCKIVPLKNGRPDLDAICKAIDQTTAMVQIQRSCGYSMRPSLSIEDIGEIVKAVKSKNPDAAVMVDNCYGEFTDTREPCAVGADLCAGSLIKNPGGGIAPTGGYICGRADLVDKCACRLTAPGVGGEVGSYEAGYRLFFEGLFLAPHVTAQAVKGAMLFGQVFADMGFEVVPAPDAPRNDIIQAIKLGTPERLIAFCRAIQAASPVDAHVLPEPWDMPGYADQVIMAAGAFVQGASIELSADAPLREPYAVYVQGALTYAHAKYAARCAAQAMEAFK